MGSSGKGFFYQMISRLGQAASSVFVLGFGWATVHAVEPSVVLSQPEIIKIQWDSRDLTAADLDADGHQDLAVINNDDARIDLYYQLAPGEKAGETERKTAVDRWEPVLKDARFERVKVLTGGIAYDLVFGDLNDDKRTDLVYTNDRDEIVVHLQGDKGDWSAKTIYEFEDLATRTGALWLGDLAKDGKNDLLCTVSDGFLIFSDGDLEARPLRYSCIYDDPRGLQVMDLNHDDRLDLIYFYLSGGKKSLMAVRFQSDDGRFVEERFFGYERSSNFPQPINWGEGDWESFIAVSAANHTLVQLAVGPLVSEDNKKPDFRRSAYAVPSSGSKTSFYAVADFTGDQRLDVVASDGPGAQVWLYQQTSSGSLCAPESFPAFAEISGLSAGDLDGDGRAELVMVSEKESVLGVARFSEEQRFAYPEVIPLSGSPETMTLGDVNGDGFLDIVCSVKGESNRTRTLESVVHDAAAKDWKVSSLSEDEVGSRIEGLRVIDIDQDGDEDVLVLSAVQSLEVLLCQDDHSFKKSETPVTGLADNVAPSAISEGDLDGDGKLELLVARDAFARSARLGEKGRAEVLDQINAPDVSASLLVSVAADIDGDNKPELLLVDGQSSKIHVMKRDEKGVYRLSQSHPGLSEITDSLVIDADDDGRSDLFLFGKDHFWWYTLQPDDFGITATQIYETDLKDVTYASVLTGKMDGDDRDDFVAFDNASSHMMELLLTDGEKLRSAMHFKLFEMDPHFTGQRGGRLQPYDGALADLSADGLLDVALLIHNRLIIYCQEER